jgi:hypothetical protein
MASSDVKICNEALTHLGQEEIGSLTEDSNSARACKAVYEPTRDEVLRVFPWNFAIERKSLARLSETPAFGFSYYYQLPTDCLRVLGMEYSDYVFKVEGNRLLCDYDTAKIVYIKRVTDPNLFDSIFIAALALRIATKIAPRIKGGVSRSLVNDLLKQYIVMVGVGESVSSQEGIAGTIEAEDWLDEHR